MTQDEIIEMAREAGFVVTHIGDPIGTNYIMIEAFANLVAAKEREACAKVVDDIELRCIAKDVDDPPLKHVAAAIRARGEQT
ncbi:hypothetical protein UFOVP188_11 [uncultured Caudovirales phage]|uniref:Uncharacterized protein n=1 Tax=uncultured Caudovirales phage TaxID=2100421 RepID=A0A6J7WHY3_9CAUD|nr:hypothetical protein UFOVP188_11 [uncultured Caudovirales phage]